MLVAPLIVDLDGRVNVNVHGNTLGGNGEHRSNQGLGPWEVNLGRVLTAGNGREWRNLLRGTSVPPLPGRHGGQPWRGRFGLPGAPGAVASADVVTHFYSQTHISWPIMQKFLKLRQLSRSKVGWELEKNGTQTRA